MSEVIQLVPKAEQERLRLIREARAIYESIFPTVKPQEKTNEPPHILLA